MSSLLKLPRERCRLKVKMIKWSVRVILLCEPDNKTASNGQEHQSHIHDLTEVIVLEEITPLPISYRDIPNIVGL